MAPPGGEAANAPTAPGNGVRNFGNQRRMISELERINALNLEPSLPKVDDGSRNVSRYSQDRDKVKNEFQQFLTVMKNNDQAKAGRQPNSSSSSVKYASGPVSGRASAAPSSSQPSLKFDQPTFMVEHTGASAKILGDILGDMLKQAVGERSEEPNWPEAKGPSYHDVLGRPTKINHPGQDGQGDAQADAGNRPGVMQGNHGRPHMQGQDMNAMRPQGPPSMPQGNMQQQPGGYMVAPGGAQQGQPQMPMFMQGMGQAPQGMMPMQGMPGGQQMVFGHGGQMFAAGPHQQMGMPMGMMAAPAQGGPNPQGGAMPPYDGQQQHGGMMFMPVMMAQDQQGNVMMPPQGMQGYPQQPGGNNNPQQGGYMMQQPAYQQQGNGG